SIETLPDGKRRYAEAVKIMTTLNITPAEVHELDALAQTEADRYIAWPGQALAYKMGQLTIRKLRDEARAQPGSKFDIKAFHDEVLNGGSMPLDLLQERVEQWIKAQKPTAASSDHKVMTAANWGAQPASLLL